MAVFRRANSAFASCVHVISLYTIISHTECFTIIEHTIEPSVVSNCSAVTLTCHVDIGHPSVDVWWTFRGENISKLSDVIISTDKAEEGIWQLELKCATLDHKGSYACNAQAKNESEVVYRKEAVLRIYVPVTIELDRNLTSGMAGEKTNITCLVSAYPLPVVVDWFKNNELINTTGDKAESFSDEMNSSTVTSFLIINNLEREDNGTYICVASNDFSNATAGQDLMVQEPPEVDFLQTNISADDPTVATLHWHIVFDGNLPVQKFHLQRESSIEPEISVVDDDIPTDVTSYTVQGLLPGVAYTFHLSAVNEAGASSWKTINISLPADVPPKVSWVHVLASTNETLLFGWRRPNHDNGANITHYVVDLRHNGKLVANKTMDIQAPGRNNHMYLFVALDPGESYSFQVQACNALGCGGWSDALDGATSDGMPDPPRNVQVKCEHDYTKNTDFIIVTWDLPENARGTIVGYNVTLQARARFINDNGQPSEEKNSRAELVDVKTNKLEYITDIRPNTEYTIQMCTVNKGGCGIFTNITSNSQCTSVSNVPTVIPQYSIQRLNNTSDCHHLKLKWQRVSERNGSIMCYRIIIIRLRKGQDLNSLPSEPRRLNISTYAKVHSNNGFGAYVAEAFRSEEFVNEVVIGDNIHHHCDTNTLSGKRRHIILDSTSNIEVQDFVQDGILSPDTNYTGYVEIRVEGPNNTILVKASPYFQPIATVCTVSIGSSPTPPPTENSAVAVFGVVSGILLVLVAFVLAMFIIRRKHGHQVVESREPFGLTTLIMRTINRNGHLPRNKGGALSKLPRLGPICAEELPSAFVEKHQDNDLLFQSEFSSLPDCFKDRTTHASEAPENQNKNRYPDIKAYDQTRVQLPMVENISGSDYVNANFVEGYKGRKIFICAQGPLDHTVTDFWRMLWEHRVTVLVMLTGIEEHGQVKCAQYWDDSGPKHIDKMFNVSVISKIKFSDYAVRRLHVECVKDNLTEEREILHFHFTLWKDFLAPEQPSWLLRFIKRVNEHYCSDRGPLLVHCSAGVGRTGTFVAIDGLLQQLEEEGHVDIFSYVSNLRHQRNFLVQSLKQYIFVYRALMEHAQFGDTEIEIRHLKDHYDLLKEKVPESDKSRLSVEFEKLNEVIEDPKTCCVGAMDMNVVKNRYEFIVPYDINRVILPPSPLRDHSTYINASFIQGYDRTLSFIITQDPLESTMAEFWRLIKEQYITTLVMLSELGEGQTKCQQYWPCEKDVKEFDYVQVKYESSEINAFYTRRCFSVVNTKNHDKHSLQQYQFSEWPGSTGTVPEGTVGLLALIDDVQQNQESQTASGPVTVHCSGGGDRSSVFVTLSVLIQQLKAEERVDVFQAARYTRSQRQCMLQTLAQYDFLYKSLLEYIVSRNLCDMGDTQL